MGRFRTQMEHYGPEAAVEPADFVLPFLLCSIPLARMCAHNPLRDTLALTVVRSCRNLSSTWIVAARESQGHSAEVKETCAVKHPFPYHVA